MRCWWRNGGVKGAHVDAGLERESAQLLGKLDAACDQLSRLVSEVQDATGELDVEEVRRRAGEQGA